MHTYEFWLNVLNATCVQVSLLELLWFLPRNITTSVSVQTLYSLLSLTFHLTVCSVLPALWFSLQSLQRVYSMTVFFLTLAVVGIYISIHLCRTC